MLIGPEAIAQRVLKNRVCLSFPLSGCFLGIWSLVFSKFWYGARNPNDVVCDRTRFFWKTSFSQTPGKWVKKEPKIDFLNLFKKKTVFNFYWIWSIMKIYIIWCVSANNLSSVKILLLRYWARCFLPIRLQYFYKNQISRTNQRNSLIFSMLIPI